MEFVNILLQIEAKAVKNASSLLNFSGHSELENGLLPTEVSFNIHISKVYWESIAIVSDDYFPVGLLAVTLDKFRGSRCLL